MANRTIARTRQSSRPSRLDTLVSIGSETLEWRLPNFPIFVGIRTSC